MVSKGFPNVTTSGQQYNIGENPSVISYTYYINFHAGTPKPQYCTVIKEHSKSGCTTYFDLRVPDYSNMVLEKAKIKLN